MTVVSSQTDPEALTLTFVAEFNANVERVWQIWEDPRQLERWWGPPTWPATFDRHDFVPGGRSSYYMTGPDGEKARGWWVTTAIRSPEHLEFDDGFADDDGEPTGDLGVTHAVVTLEQVEARTRMTIFSTFESADQLQQMMEMGMEEGMREAMGQIDRLLAEVRA
ncbi:SRPBCC domain-containing protein [Cryobacterium glaciale]|uniref:SRPBCC domain-containing protein n=1 Tax=Cryobacterium glaciale TaxID=1259145 RepID=A0A4V3I8X1_9MICO|nr:SRPBCC domain-containing protein [Cryobacterium glaciale]TFB76722.1 SRPBCC domain-containing protein [Cryobacterium glaciale]